MVTGLIEVSNKLEKHYLKKNLDKNHCKIWALKIHEIDCSSFAFSTNTSAKQSRPLFVLEEAASSQASLSTLKDQNCTTSSILRPFDSWTQFQVDLKAYVELMLPVSLGMSHTANLWLDPFLILKLFFLVINIIKLRHY